MAKESKSSWRVRSLDDSTFQFLGDRSGGRVQAYVASGKADLDLLLFLRGVGAGTIRDERVRGRWRVGVPKWMFGRSGRREDGRVRFVVIEKPSGSKVVLDFNYDPLPEEGYKALCARARCLRTESSHGDGELGQVAGASGGGSSASAREGGGGQPGDEDGEREVGPESGEAVGAEELRDEGFGLTAAAG